MGAETKRYLLIGYGLALLAGACTAETAGLLSDAIAQEFHRRVWTHELGLPDNRVRAILQTRDGYLWVATSRGLGRFDGRKFTVFDHINTPAFSSDNFQALAEDPTGRLWAGTPNEVAWAQENKFVSMPWPAAHILSGPSGELWLASGPSLCRQSSLNQTNLCIHLGDSQITGIEYGNAGGLWISSFAGLLSFDPKTGQVKSNRMGSVFESTPSLALKRGPSGEYWVLFGDRNAKPAYEARKWLGCFRDGAWIRPPSMDRPELICPGDASLGIDAFSHLWIAFEARSLFRWTGDRLEDLQVPQPLCIYADREGNTWVGTVENGLHRLAPRKLSMITRGDGLADENAWTVTTARDGSIWIGTETGVTRYCQGQASTFLTNTPTPALSARALAEEEDGTVWVGTMRGLYSIRSNQVTALQLPGEWVETKVRALLPARGGGVWIGTVRGLTLLRREQRTKYTKSDGLGSDEVRALLEDRAGALWIGTFGGGLSRLKDGVFSSYTEAKGLSSDNVWALHEDATGSLWAGTDNGLNRIRDGRISHINVGDGLPAKLINSILEDDDGRLWISHDHGVYWVRRDELNAVADRKASRVHAVRYDESDGMSSIETNGQKSYPAACKSPDGRLWFPTTRGVAVFDPRKVTYDNVPPLTAIEQVRANGEVVLSNSPEEPPTLRASPGEALHLPPGTGRVIEFRYTACTFVAAQNVQFRYRLLGLHDSWSDAGLGREAYFTNLRPGDYTFEVIAANHHGVWPERGAAIHFHLAPFYYETWWFYFACGMALAGFAAVALSWRLREIRRIHQLERINSLSEQRKRIARDVHDDLGASLTHILQLSTQPDGPAPTGPSETRERSRRIASIAEEAVDNIGEIVWANNPEFDTLQDLVAYSREYAANYLDAYGIALKFELPDDVPSREVTGLFRRHLFLVLKESLRNITKHARATQVRFRIAVNPAHLEFELADNGQGFSPSAHGRRGNGLLNMQQRIAELGGSLDILSAPGQGTTIQARIPWSSVSN